jgi:small multidrug resistance pump/quaternary ammonium compound-resistance protein SugE
MKMSPAVLVGLAAVLFSAGGVCMKLSAGLTRLPATLALFALFAGGAALNALAMAGRDLGVVYIIVLGLEAVLTFAAGAFFFQEAVTPLRLAGVALVVAGIACLK